MERERNLFGRQAFLFSCLKTFLSRCPKTFLFCCLALYRERGRAGERDAEREG